MIIEKPFVPINKLLLRKRPLSALHKKKENIEDQIKVREQNIAKYKEQLNFLQDLIEKA